MNLEIHDSVASDLDATTLYGILQLRSSVLVVEQHAPYPDLDGRDLQRNTVHIWATESDDVVGCARLLSESDGVCRLGRLCTAHHARGRGIARKLVERAIEIGSDKTIETNTHSNLVSWYESFGFEASGPSFHEVGIPHTPMRRSGATLR